MNQIVIFKLIILFTITTKLYKSQVISKRYIQEKKINVIKCERIDQEDVHVITY